MGATVRQNVLLGQVCLLLVGGARIADAGVCQVPGTGAISGRITAAASGDPIVGAEVVATSVSGEVVTTTGPTGHYQFATLTPGDYFVHSRRTVLLVDEVWPGTACDQLCAPLSVGTVIPVAAGGFVEGIDLALAVGGRLEGVVYRIDGVTPAAGATVDFFALGPSFSASIGSAEADGNGAWFLEGLETRSYKVRALAPGLFAELYPNASCPSMIGCDFVTVGDPIVVTAGATTSGIDLALEAGGTISGTVTDLASVPIAGLVVSVINAAGTRGVTGETDANGDWTLPEALPAGTYHARTSSEHLDEVWDDIPCDPFCGLTQGTAIVVGVGPVSGIDFAITRLGTISGTVLESGTGLPLAKAVVVARSDLGGGLTETADDGTYRIGGLVDDSYLMAVVHGEHVGEVYADAGVCYVPASCQPATPATLVEVVAAGVTTGIDFALAPSGTVAGTVTIAGTVQPVVGATVELFQLDGDLEVSTVSDGAGEFAFTGVPAGLSYRVVAQPSIGVGLLGEVWEEQPCAPGSCPPGAGTQVPVGLAAPACLGFTLNGEPVGLNGIAGLVTGEGGPLANIPIRVIDQAGALAAFVTTDTNGTYLTTGAFTLAAGTYYVLANETNAQAYEAELYDDLLCNSCDPTTGTPVTVVEGATTGGIDFVLARFGPPPLPLIFLEDCRPAGCTYFGGFENSRFNRSSILNASSASLPPFALPAALWDDLVACVRRAYRPFAVEVTDVDPGPVPHLEHVVAGDPRDIGFDIGILGVAPRSCSFIANSISFTFPEVHAGVPLLDQLCWTVVHEIGHQHGLEHHHYAPDAMTYLPGCGAKQLPARDVTCGEFTPQPCTCDGATENSYSKVRAAYGASGFLFEDGLEIVEPGSNCAWSDQLPPPPPAASASAPGLSGSMRCGTLETSHPGLQPRPASRTERPVWSPPEEAPALPTDAP
jgi:hypothetical protein